MHIRHTVQRKPILRFFFLALLAFILSFVGIVQLQQRVEGKPAKHFIWSMEADTNTIHLLGSIHVLKRGHGPLPLEMESAYDQSKTVVFETDIDRASSPAMQAKMISLGLYPQDQTLEQNISQETYLLLKKKVAAAGLPFAQFERFRPWLCALTLAVLELHRLGFEEEHSIDRYFLQKSKRDEKEIAFLETVEYQMELLAGMDEHQQESFLEQTLDDLEVVETMASDMVDAWTRGDADGLNSIIQISMKDHPEIYDRFFVDRNKKWAMRIEDMIREDEDVLVVVGAGHLVGKDSIITILRQKGFKVEQR